MEDKELNLDELNNVSGGIIELNNVNLIDHREALVVENTGIAAPVADVVLDSVVKGAAPAVCQFCGGIILGCAGGADKTTTVCKCGGRVKAARLNRNGKFI